MTSGDPFVDAWWLWARKADACAHQWEFVPDWQGDREIGWADCSFKRCRLCGLEDTPEPGERMPLAESAVEGAITQAAEAVLHATGGAYDPSVLLHQAVSKEPKEGMTSEC